MSGRYFLTVFLRGLSLGITYPNFWHFSGADPDEGWGWLRLEGGGGWDWLRVHEGCMRCAWGRGKSLNNSMTIKQQQKRDIQPIFLFSSCFSVFFLFHFSLVFTGGGGGGGMFPLCLPEPARHCLTSIACLSVCDTMVEIWLSPIGKIHLLSFLSMI